MKTTYNWLKEYTDVPDAPDALAHRLTMLGLEVDEVVSLERSFQGVVVGKVVEKNAHPNADKLSVCRVDVGGEELSVVCGAANVAVGQKVPLAKVGAKLPNGVQLKRVKIRGVESEGMICSEIELGISSRSEGIMVLDNGAKIGADFLDVVGERDYLIDIDVTPNRPDCFGVLGIAREIATATETPFEKPAVHVVESTTPVSQHVKVTIHDSQKCPRYTARYIENIRVKPSPSWLAERLERVGIRSINNIVDVTNFVMMETGQPLHAFDYDLLTGGEINVRCAADGEEFMTLDDKTHKLHSECLLICDGEKPVALGGMMGGRNSEVSADTVNILLESAYFDPVNIRRTSKFLGISTESSKRFERGVDPNGAVYALDRAAQLLAELGEGDVAKGVVDKYPNRISPIKIKLRPERVRLLLGVAIPVPRIRTILTGLGFGVSGEEVLEVEVPTFRPDVVLEADLVEEVGRVFGYDNIPSDFSAVIDQSVPANASEALTSRLKSTLVALGLSEVVTYDLIGKDAARSFLQEGEPVTLIKPLSEELSTLRTSLIPSLLHTVCWNINHFNKNIKFFEVGNTFVADNKAVREYEHIAAVFTGAVAMISWQNKSAPVDVYDVKGCVEQLLTRNKVANCRFKPAEETSTVEQRLQVFAGEDVLGYLGKLTGSVLNHFSLEQPVFFFDLNLAKVHSACTSKVTFTPIPKYPPINRDLALIIDESIEAGKIIETVRKSGGQLLKNIEVFDVFTGEQIGTGLKSIALNLSFYSLERTLQEQEVEKAMQAVLQSLAKQFSARLRD
ncbi:MAG: phenylalanine--tRNA ligase subunit beta [Calditrichaeota bacterium]|nr:phenylalanine--tRNA ligase subunit beta [Calditrichota bacterium]